MFPLTFQHRAGVSPYTSAYALAETCVFAKQLLGPILCGQLSLALLLPKLRSHFAEFLNNASPVGLRILSSSTCVGLRYGYIINNSGFSWQPAHILPALRPTSRLQIVHRICLMHSYLACTGFSIPGLCSLSASPQFCYDTVQESLPVIHRLRLSTSP